MMKNQIVAFVVTALLAAGVAVAQQGPPTFAPVEVIGCNFIGNNNMDDLDPIIDDWNEWADSIDLDDYTAIMMQPFFMNADFPFDFLWLGAFEDGEAMGSGYHQWVLESGNLPDRFAQITECPQRLGLASLNLKPPSGNVDGDDHFIVEFSNCTVHENRTGPEAAQAMREWIDYLSEGGSNSGHWLAIPGPGEASDATYSFKWISSYPSYESLGRDYELAFNNGGIGRRTDLFSRLLSCDGSRVYNSSFIRQSADDS